MSKKLLKPKTKIPYAKHKITKEDIQSVVDVLNTDWLTQGSQVDVFEKKMASFCGAKYAVAVSHGTAALHLACLVAGLKTGDEAITTPISFVATSNAVLYTGAKPVFAEVDYETGNLDPKSVIKKCSKKTKAILPVHLAGFPVEMKEIYQFAQKKKLVVIEDACHALGATYKGQNVGSCKYSDMTIFSFHPVKHITTGEGGCITTNSKKYYEKLKALSSHGVYKTPEIMSRLGGWAYEMRDLGFNYRITDFQCALGVSQLKKIKSFVKRRNEIAKKYNKAFLSIEDQITLPNITDKDRTHALHLYLLRLKLNKNKVNRRQLYDRLRDEGVFAQVHYIPIHQQPYYRKRKEYQNLKFPQAEKYYSEVISLPMFPGMSDKQVSQVIKSVKKVLK